MTPTYSVTSIGDYAFDDCSTLASVVIPNSVTSIGDYAFWDCTSLASVVIPNSVTSIGDYAFCGCSSLASVVIPNSVTSIEDFAFYRCASLASVVIPNSVTSIGNSAFYYCPSLATVIIPSSVTSIGESAFSGCSSLASVEIPSSVTSIGESAFSDCTSLASVEIPNSVTSISFGTFSGCSSLASVEIPSSVTSIGESAFSDCSSLESLAFNANNCVTCGSSTHPAFPQSISSLTIGENVTRIPDFFLSSGCKIKSLSIPNSVTTIGKGAFRYCTSLASIKIPENVTTIDREAFYWSHINSITFGTGLISIEGDAFKESIIAKAFWLGNTPPTGHEQVNAYTNYASNFQYYHLNNLKIYEFLSSKFTVDGIVYVPVSPSERTCDVVDCLYSPAYSTADISDKISNKGIDMTVNNIQQYAFYNNSGIKSLALSNIGFIEDSAFYGCSAITEITISNSVTALGYSAFQGCSALKSAVLGTGFATLPTKVFSGCSSLESISIPNNVSKIGNYAFEGCSSLESISIPNNVSSIADYAFEGCSSLADISIADSDSEISIGSNGSSPLFADCPLDEVYIGRKLSYKTDSNYGYSPFYRNTSLRTVEITDAETEIYDNEFYGCSGLKSLKIGNGVTKIGTRAFSGCYAMRSFECGENAKSIGKEAFSDCTGLKYFTSKAITPPVCGTQALDDINKWECTLRVPQESIDDYQQAAQWKEFFFIEDLSKILVDKIELNTTEVQMNIRESLQLSATILPANATNQAIVWESSDVSVADVDSNGLVTGLKEGTATITARSADGNAEATCVLTVKDMSGIDTVNAPSTYTLVRTPNGYIVKNACGARVEVYSADGRIVYLAPSYAEEEIALPAGLYIVRAANRAWKVRF